MDTAIFDIDHLILSVSDSKTAGETFARMGFTITPRGQLPGLNNRLICFSGGQGNSPNFVELMSLEDADKAPPAMVEALKIPNRPVLMVAATGNAENTRLQLSDAGIPTSPVINGERDWTLESGEVLDLAFSIVLPAVGQAPFYWIACQHKTPHHYLRRDFVEHDNSSGLLKKIIAVSQNPVVAAKHFEKHWAANTSMPESSSAHFVVSRGVVELHIHNPDSYEKQFPGIKLQRDEDHIAGFAVSVKSLRNVENILRANAFEPIIVGSAILLPPSQACGSLVVFEESKLEISQMDFGPLPI